MKIDGMKWARALILLPTLLLGACVFDPDPEGEAEPFGDADLTVLFVGNSLTYTNGMPVMVQVIAEAAGKSFEYRSLTAPNFSLEDHWVSGAGDIIRDLKADVVVLQQGPSSLPEDVTFLPAELTPSSTGLQPISLPEETAQLIYGAVQRTVTIW